MVCIDIESDCSVPLRGCQGCTTRAKCLSEHHGHTTMQDAHGLACARIDGCPRTDEVIAYLQELDAEVGHRGADVNGSQSLD